MLNFKQFLLEIYPPDDLIRRKISWRIKEKGVPEKIAIAQGWTEYRVKNPKKPNQINKIDNPYYKAKQGIE